MNKTKILMEIIQAPNTFDSIKLFPDELEDDEHIFYHGTNEFYSNEIESYGLFPNHKPLTGYFYEIFNLAAHLRDFTSNNDDFKAFNLEVNSVEGFYKDFTRISFSSVSICAANYSIGTTSGGQGLRKLKELKQAIIELDYSKLTTMCLDISDIQMECLKNLENILNTITLCNGVVYAFKIQNSDIKNLNYSNHCIHSVLLSKNHIKPDRLIAKMVIPLSTIIDPCIIKDGNTKTIQLGQNTSPTSFIGQIIDLNRERHNIKEVIKNYK